MDFFEVIERRCSYRGEFEATPIPRDRLDRILKAGIRAPSCYNIQTTTILVVLDCEIRRRIYNLIPIPSTWTAPVILLILSEQDTKTECTTENYSAVAENLLLAITASGYAGIWLGKMPLAMEAFQQLHEILNISPEKRIRAILPFGKPVYAQKQNEKPTMEQMVTFIE